MTKKIKKLNKKPVNKKQAQVLKDRFQIVYLGQDPGYNNELHDVFAVLDTKEKRFLRGGFEKSHVIVFANYLNQHQEAVLRFHYA